MAYVTTSDMIICDFSAYLHFISCMTKLHFAISRLQFVGQKVWSHKY
jgi:hypothetical protein